MALWSHCILRCKYTKCKRGLRDERGLDHDIYCRSDVCGRRCMWRVPMHEKCKYIKGRCLLRWHQGSGPSHVKTNEQLSSSDSFSICFVVGFPTRLSSTLICFSVTYWNTEIMIFLLLVVSLCVYLIVLVWSFQLLDYRIVHLQLWLTMQWQLEECFGSRRERGFCLPPSHDWMAMYRTMKEKKPIKCGAVWFFCPVL